jgi:4a-hydroxytetrahydrobiopterin dehydratase
MKIQKLSNPEIQIALANLNDKKSNPWFLEDDKLTKPFLFKNFKSAFAFMTLCADYAEEVNHHPEWFNVYNKVKVQLTTHEVDGISAKDFDLALKMDEFERSV